MPFNKAKLPRLVMPVIILIVAGIIIFMIFNMVSIYLNPINKALGR